MDADTRVDALIRRKSRVTLNNATLHLDRAAHSFDHASELDDCSVTGTFDDTPAVDGDSRINKVAAERP
jgi:hypothetical protein